MQEASATFADSIVVGRAPQVVRSGVVAPSPMARARAVDAKAPAATPAPTADASDVTDATEPVDAPIPLNRNNILDATDECMRRWGYDGTTIRRIAGELRCAVGSIYRYFADKRDLLMALTERRMSPAAEAAEGNADLDALIRRYLELAGADFEAYQLLFWLAAVRKDAPLPIVIQQVITGLERRLGSPQYARIAWTLLHGAATTRQSADDTVAAVRAITRRRSARQADAMSTTTPSVSVVESGGDEDDVCLL